MPTPMRIQAVVTETIDYGDGIHSVAFKVPSRAIRFKAGQFLHLALDPFDPTQGYWPDSRVFSIASQPGGETLRIIYSVKGTFTKRMENELVVGRTVWLKLPYGDFIVEKHITPGQPIVFIAGGTGISPFIPYLCEVVANGGSPPITLYYGIRDEKYFLYQELMTELTRHATVHIVQGLFDIKNISKSISEIDNSVTFLSGPPKMIHSFQSSLVEAGYPHQSIIIDAWE